MEFNEFADKLINKINNWKETIMVIDSLSRDDIIGLCFDENGKHALNIYLEYNNSKFSVKINNDEMYSFDIEEREYKRFVFNLEDTVHYHNKQILDKFLGI